MKEYSQNKKIRLKDKFKLRKVGEFGIAIPIGENNTMNGNIILNKTGSFVWKLLENEMCKDEIIKELINKYNVTEKKAIKDIEEFLNICYTNDII